MAHRIMQSVPDEGGFAVVRRNWAVPILAVTETPKRFSAIKSGLGAITDRALSKSLCALEDRDWLRREINVTQRTPFPTYHAVNAGRDISLAIGLAA